MKVFILVMSILANIVLSLVVVGLLFVMFGDWKRNKIGQPTIRGTIQAAFEAGNLDVMLDEAAEELENVGPNCDKAAKITAEVMSELILVVGSMSEETARAASASGSVKGFPNRGFEHFQRVYGRVARVCSDHKPFQNLNRLMR